MIFGLPLIDQPTPLPEKESPEPNKPQEDLETPDNTNVEIENEETAAIAEEDGKFIGQITYLKDILSAAWKSINNFSGEPTKH